jgi:hypothetical protein
VSENEFYGQVGEGGPDHAYWGRPEDMTMSRPAYKIDTSHPGKNLLKNNSLTHINTILFSEDSGGKGIMHLIHDAIG